MKKLISIFCCIFICFPLLAQELTLRESNGKKRVLKMEEVMKLPKDTVYMNDHKGNAHLYEGPALNRLLQLLGVPQGNMLKGVELRKAVEVICKDGYTVLFTLTELDTLYTGTRLILAYKIDGELLYPERGPFRLIVDGDKIAARSCYQVTEIVVGVVKELQ